MWDLCPGSEAHSRLDCHSVYMAKMGPTSHPFKPHSLHFLFRPFADKHFPYAKLTDTQRLENFDDGLHFTSKGYDRVGELLAEALKPHIPAGGNVQC